MNQHSPTPFSSVDPDGLMEYSVVFTDRSLNHMSMQFREVMTDISSMLRGVYNASACVLVPGGGTFGMEAVARQFATDKKVKVIRNGWFSYRWTQIFEAGDVPASVDIMMAGQTMQGDRVQFAPAPIEDVVAAIHADKPDVVFAPHVETSAGVILPDGYIEQVAQAVHAVGGLFVLDCVASGCIWVDMAALGVDVLISAPQKGWSATPCAGVVMLGERAVAALDETQSTSFAIDLKKWHQIMQAYENGGHAYHATMPTDGLRQFRDTMVETRDFGFDKAKAAQLELGRRVRDTLGAAGFKGVAAEGFRAPGVVVCHTDDPNIHNGSKFAAQGMQIAAGVPLQVGEPDDWQTFRIGLFGLDKLKDVDAAVDRLETVVKQVALQNAR
ncbi:MAG: aminotransferase class V-fold PLP-dependent enzyme [Pseudomonadota bacterium]